MASMSPDDAISLLEKVNTKYICTLCESCDKNDDRFSLELHCFIDHRESSHVICIYCLRPVVVTKIQEHVNRHFSIPDQRPFICPSCSDSFETSRALGQHALSVHTIEPSLIFYKCGHCSKPMETADKLHRHLSNSCLRLYHCHYPHCFVKSTNYSLLLSHMERSHGITSSHSISTRLFTCPFDDEVEPTVELKEKSSGHFSLFCAYCSFGTTHLENFAEHIAICSLNSSIAEPPSLSVTCILYHCKQCGWMSSVKNMIMEHIRDMHPMHSEAENLISEEFTVPRSEEPSSITPPLVSPLPMTPSLTAAPLLEPQADDVFSVVTSRLNEWSRLLDPANLSNIFSASPAFTTSIPRVNGVSSNETRPTNGTDSLLNQLPPSSSSAANYTGDFSSLSMPEADLLSSPVEADDSNQTHSSTQMVPHSKVNEYVQLYFNENAFLSAYTTRNNKAGGAIRSKEINNILPKLRQFATYKIPILGRANQRRVAGCPECMKPFNHGFTDLKKHLLVNHLNVRKELTKFVLDFTHSARSHIQTMKPESTMKSLSNIKQNLFSIRATRTPNKIFRKRNNKIPSSAQKLDPSLSSAKPITTFHGCSEILGTSPVPTYTGSAPIHRVIPHTGVSDEHEDMKSLDEIAAEAPIGRGGIIPLDNDGNSNPDALLAAMQPSLSGSLSRSELFLPRLGRQHIKLSYSYPVFIRLLIAYKVSAAEQIQLINRMNHYARLHVIMDVLVPNGTQRHFSCPTCQYMSIHSLADIRKHIMGSHCGISTKRFRLCLRASRHDTTTYRLHSDDKMIHFVEDYQRRKVHTPEYRYTESSTTLGKSGFVESLDASKPRTKLCPPIHSLEELETLAIEEEGNLEDEDVYNYGSCLESDPEVDNELPNGHSSTHQLPQNDDYNTSNDANVSMTAPAKNGKEYNRRIDLPFSSNVLRILMERENMGEQLQTITKKMEIYSSYHLIVTSWGNRIHSYTCVCGRVFPVIRDSTEIDIRPASLADCRRHILGVHARIPQELLTLCCQASRISKESGYRIYSDSSLLALAEQHRFRSTRMQGFKGSKQPPSKKGESLQISPNYSASSPTSSANHTHEPPTQVSMRKSDTNSNRSLPPMLRAPVRKSDPEQPNSSFIDSHQSSPFTTPLPSTPDPIAVTTRRKHGVHLPCSNQRHSGLDLDGPRRLLTPDEAVEWGRLLSLPNNWTLERIVNLPYNVNLFDDQLRRLIPNDAPFIEILHERMATYSRHSVYIVRLVQSNNQRIFVCCSCLTTSQHGFGDVRKHVLGVHAHIPERFKTIAMNSSRLNREDYSLQIESYPLSSATKNTGKSSLQSPNSNSSNSDRVLRRRRRSSEFSPTLRSHTISPTKKRFYSDFEYFDNISHQHLGKDKPIPPNVCLKSSPPIFATRVNNRSSSPENSHSHGQGDLHRPPIILTLPRPKAFRSENPSPSSSSDCEKLSNEDPMLVTDEANFESRSRRSMILKSKRPCPSIN